MSVAETPATEQVPQNPQKPFAAQSLLGGLFLLASVALVFSALPMFWGETLQIPAYTNDFLSSALLFVVAALAITGLWIVGQRVVGGSSIPGVRAGAFFAAVMIFCAVWIVIKLGGGVARQVEEVGAGATVLGVMLAALLAGIAYLFVASPNWASLMEAIEHQGWFHASPYKGNQGVRVRRGTIMGVLVLGFCGIYTLVSHKAFGSDRLGDNDWFWYLPYTDERRWIPLMFHIHLLLPLLLGIVLLWFAWRLVNVPTFADFLIATEAEMNKVSWTTRKRLVQDTIVVLVTVVLFSLFLFLLDLMWIQILRAPFIEVLKVDLRAQKQKQQEKQQW
jgi:preprotein translocase SecE subunit